MYKCCAESNNNKSQSLTKGGPLTISATEGGRDGVHPVLIVVVAAAGLKNQAFNGLNPVAFIALNSAC